MTRFWLWNCIVALVLASACGHANESDSSLSDSKEEKPVRQILRELEEVDRTVTKRSLSFEVQGVLDCEKDKTALCEDLNNRFSKETEEITKALVGKAKHRCDQISKNIDRLKSLSLEEHRIRMAAFTTDTKGVLSLYCERVDANSEVCGKVKDLSETIKSRAIYQMEKEDLIQHEKKWSPALRSAQDALFAVPK